MTNTPSMCITGLNKKEGQPLLEQRLQILTERVWVQCEIWIIVRQNKEVQVLDQGCAKYVIFQHKSILIIIYFTDKLVKNLERSNKRRNTTMSKTSTHCLEPNLTQSCKLQLFNLMFLLFITLPRGHDSPTPRNGDVNSVNIFLLPCLAIQNPIRKSHQIGISSFCTSNQSRRLLHSYLIGSNNLTSRRAQTGRNRIILKVVIQLPPPPQIMHMLKLIRSYLSHTLRLDVGFVSSIRV